MTFVAPIWTFSILWNLHHDGQIKSIEKVQMGATKLVITVKRLSYEKD